MYEMFESGSIYRKGGHLSYMRIGSTMPKSTCGNGGRMGGIVPKGRNGLEISIDKMSVIKVEM